jgi:hypothetical protein
MKNSFLKRRLAKLEAKRDIGPPRSECWVNSGDGLLRHKDGRTMTQEAFDAAFPNAQKITLDIFGNSDRD